MAQGYVDLGIQRQDGRTVLSFDNRMLDVKQQTRKGKDGEQVETGVKVYKLEYKETVKAVLEGAGLVIANEDGSAAVAHKVTVTIEERDEAALKAKRDAEGTASFLKLVRRRCGLSTSKQKVDDRDKLTLADLRDWVAGKRQVIRRDFDSLTVEAQAEVEKMAKKLEEKGAVATKKARVLPMDILKAEYAEGVYESNPERKALVAEAIKEHDERVARLAKGREAAKK